MEDELGSLKDISLGVSTREINSMQTLAIHSSLLLLDAVFTYAPGTAAH